jgi:hypothetical protein
MRKLALVGLTVLVAMALVGCGGVTKEKAEKVYKDYLSAQLKETKDGKNPAPQALMDKAAKDNGFKDWADFAAKSTKSLGADGWTKVSQEVTKWYEGEVKKWTEEQMKKAAGGGGEPDKKDEKKE